VAMRIFGRKKTRPTGALPPLLVSRAADDPHDPRLSARSEIKLPQEITETALVARNGEYAWRREDLPDAFKAITEAGGIILGGELWGVRAEEIRGVLPSSDPHEPPGIWYWDCPSRSADESLDDFRDRSLNESLAAIDAFDPELFFRPDVLSDLWFNVTFVSEQRYWELESRRSDP
jgi:hypothetical protein